uniref:HTH_48 domain-containing protein n=1 Tax=Caenorhabditis japonica TaxID=281687 RepID=A0A8R1I2W1_CAEJA
MVYFSIGLVTVTFGMFLVICEKKKKVEQIETKGSMKNNANVQGNIIKAHNPEHEEKKVQLQKCDTPKKNEMKGKIKGDKKQQNVAAGAKNANDGLVTFGNKDMIQERNPEAMTKSKRKKAIMALETQEEFV